MASTAFMKHSTLIYLSICTNNVHNEYLALRYCTILKQNFLKEARYLGFCLAKRRCLFNEFEYCTVADTLSTGIKNLSSFVVILFLDFIANEKDSNGESSARSTSGGFWARRMMSRSSSSDLIKTKADQVSILLTSGAVSLYFLAASIR